MIRIKQKGDYKKISKYLTKLKNPFNLDILRKFGEQGVTALSLATPVDTGLTKDSWYYKIVQKEDGDISIQFCNSNVADYVPIAVILQYGHATGTGGWVEGRDYINPAIQPVFDDMVDEAWKEITKV